MLKSLLRTVRDLGLILDSELSLSKHVSSVVRSCYLQLRSLGKLRPMLNQAAATSMAFATVMSRVYYCNIALCGVFLPLSWTGYKRYKTLLPESSHVLSVLHTFHLFSILCIG